MYIITFNNLTFVILLFICRSISVDLTEICKSHPVPHNTTCSWRGWNEAERPAEDWFAGCGCYMAMNAAGP